MNPEALESKEKGNECMKSEKYLEAMLHYTQSIKLESDNPTTYSNRSLAFLKSNQYFFALEDAKTTIQLMPKWTKGYYRKGEVEFAAEQYVDATESYKTALALNPSDSTIKAQLEKSTEHMIRQRKYENRIPLYGTAIGLILAVAIIAGDVRLTNKPTLTNGIVQLVLIVALTLLGFGAARIYRWFIVSLRREKLAPPTDLFPSDKRTPGFPGSSLPPRKQAASTSKNRPNTAKQRKK